MLVDLLMIHYLCKTKTVDCCAVLCIFCLKFNFCFDFSCFLSKFHLLQEIGVTKVGHIKRIQQAIKDLDKREAEPTGLEAGPSSSSAL